MSCVLVTNLSKSWVVLFLVYLMIKCLDSTDIKNIASSYSSQPRCMLDWCFSQLLKNNVFPFACQVKGKVIAYMQTLN